jgi:hypothetical protein
VGVGWGAKVQVPAFRQTGGFDIIAICGLEPNLNEIAASLDIPFGKVHFTPLIAPYLLIILSLVIGFAM